MIQVNLKYLVKSKSALVILLALMPLLIACLNVEKNEPKFLIINKELLAEIMNDRESPLFEASINSLLKHCDSLLTVEPKSVMDKKIAPPSGDKHDYLSISTYRWPDTTKADGLPWIRRDGVPNTEAHKATDRLRYSFTQRSIAKLAVAYHFSKNSAYVKQALKFIRVWYINDATKMNPHFNYSQHIPGENTGSFWGIIDGTLAVWIIDSIELMEDSGLVTDHDRNGLKEWFKSYYTWLVESEFGKQESAMMNNHGIYYDLQKSSIAIFLSYDEEAKAVFKKLGEYRLASQIMDDGSQPEELARTRSFHYSVFSLLALTTLSRNAEAYGIDLWHYPGKDQSKIKNAIDFILPAGLGEKPWPYKDIRFNTKKTLYLLANAKSTYPDLTLSYEKMLQSQDEINVFEFLLSF